MKREYYEVVNKFMHGGDREALELLYEKTNDEIVKIALNWLDNYELEIMQKRENAEWFMYDDIVSYLFKKYELY